MPMKRGFWILFSIGGIACACAAGDMSESQRAAVREEVSATLRAAYDLSKPGVEERMLSLYPTAGPVVSASSGRVVRSRDTLAMGIKFFWENVGVNMRGPVWIWDSLYVDVLSPTSAVVTAAYHIPHQTPRNQPHVIAGAMTALFGKRDGKWVILQEHLSDVPAGPDEPSMAPDSTPRKPRQ